MVAICKLGTLQVHASTTMCQCELSHSCQLIIVINVFPLHLKFQRVATKIKRVHDWWMDEKKHQHDVTTLIKNWLNWSCIVVVPT